MAPGFDMLYHHLGIQPGCTLDQFKQSYRRYLAEAHPDRIARNLAEDDLQGNDAAKRLDLPEITVLYKQAIDFHQTHGRLPGAVMQASKGMKSASMHFADPDTVIPSSSGYPNPSRRGTAVLFVILATLAIATWQTSSEHATPEESTSSNHTLETENKSTRVGGRLELGMDDEQVRAIQGAPVRINGDEWEYGPSWLRFEKGRLVDWYSSPLYRLRTPSETPTPR